MRFSELSLICVVCLPFTDVGGINSRYYLGRRSFKFFGPVNVFTPYHALMLAVFEGQQWKVDKTCWTLVPCEVFVSRFRKSAMSGVTSGVLAQFFASPTDLIKVQIQMEGKRRLLGKSPRFVKWFSDLTHFPAITDVSGITFHCFKL